MRGPLCSRAVVAAGIALIAAALVVLGASLPSGATEGASAHRAHVIRPLPLPPGARPVKLAPSDVGGVRVGVQVLPTGTTATVPTASLTPTPTRPPTATSTGTAPTTTAPATELPVVESPPAGADRVGGTDGAGLPTGAGMPVTGQSGRALAVRLAASFAAMAIGAALLVLARRRRDRRPGA
ncbi:hypothetical protein GCM10009682_03980 [Luedemannella flava]|uniref:Gram-positive cocci surface proteins LPxTG domain-containing protein n=1 Tax=Luedemannella flava TaxID=349316 RepID=A0ABN2LDT9_9ACTN